MKNWQSQSNSKVKGKNMLAHYSLDCFYQKKKKIRGTKKKKVLSKNHIFKPKAKSKQIQKKCPSINHIYLHYNLDKKIITKKNSATTTGKAFKCFSSSTLLAL